MKKKILISTGGSGGHVVPAITVHDHLKNEYDIIISTDQSLLHLDYVVQYLSQESYWAKGRKESRMLKPLRIRSVSEFI